MDYLSAPTLGLLAVSMLTFYVLGRISRLKPNARGCPLPPGPKGLPFIGNLLDMPHSHEWEWAAEQAKTYGDLVYVNVVGHGMLFINSYCTAVELLENRSAIYSSRPRYVMATELEGWDWFAVFMPYGERLRKYRAFLHRFLQPSVLPQYMPLQTREVHIMLNAILNSPRQYDEHIRRFPGAVMLMMAYGHEVKREDDPFIHLSEAGIRSAADAESVFMVDIFPWLKHIPAWVPGTGFKKVAREAFKVSQAMLKVPYAETKKKLMSGTAKPCMATQLIEDNTDENGEVVDEDVIAGSTGIMYGAAQDTITTAIMTAVLAMVLYPDVQVRAQEELENVVGKDTLPTFDDQKKLPYVNAICAEALRWEVISPLAVAHCTSEDDYYNGFFIPKGTAILPNSWAMMRNPQEYPDPEKFNPDRWIPKPGKKVPIHSASMAFGYGRRICPGNDFAQNALFIAVASILAVFKLEKSVEEGRCIEPRADYRPSFVRRANRFECALTPRSSGIATLVREHTF